MELVSVNDLTKTYSKHAVVDHVSFDLQPGKCVALLGPNGAENNDLTYVSWVYSTD